MPSLAEFYQWCADQAGLIYKLALLVAICWIVVKKSWMTGVWVLLGFGIFGVFLFSDGVMEKLSKSLGGIFGF